MSDAQIFQVFSLMYIAVGIGILVSPRFYRKLIEDYVETSSSLYFGGLLALTVGYLLVAFHNTWTKDFSVIITIVGWISLIKGLLILIRPKIMIELTKAIMSKRKYLKIQAVIVIIIGLIFSFFGFCSKSPI